jgi:uncharacterized 2Fe-2S/4Fe-4S cluster protein (DUF4445 family)
MQPSAAHTPRKQRQGWVRTLSLTPPSLQDNTADADRLVNALKLGLKTDAVRIDLDLLKEIPSRLRAFEYRVRCVVFKDRSHWLLTHVDDGRRPLRIWGVAVDLGTTRVALRLVDLESGEALAETSFDNPQLCVGPDILTRIHHAESPQGARQLSRSIVAALDQHTADLCRAAGGSVDAVRLIAVAGNTAMTHLFLGLETRWMIREPYIPAVNRPGVMRAADLGFGGLASARVFVFPNVGSYFGGDLIAGILHSGLHLRQTPAILVDVGTNAEVVLGNRDWLIACAGAAGPALEGGVTRMGMLAGPGVIDRVAIDPATRRFAIHTIGDEAPRGICGSGVIDLAAQLFLAGMIDVRGKILPAACAERFKEVAGTAQVVVVPADGSATGFDLCLSQADLDSLIRSKAAMYTILETITSAVGLALGDLATFYVAGTFGSLIDPAAAIAIGMLPDLPLAHYRSLGNSSLAGATQALADASAPDEIDRIRDRVTYLELNVNQDFMNRFSAARFLPHTDPGRFPSVQPPGADLPEIPCKPSPFRTL